MRGRQPAADEIKKMESADFPYRQDWPNNTSRQISGVQKLLTAIKKFDFQNILAGYLQFHFPMFKRKNGLMNDLLERVCHRLKRKDNNNEPGYFSNLRNGSKFPEIHRTSPSSSKCSN